MDIGIIELGSVFPYSVPAFGLFYSANSLHWILPGVFMKILGTVVLLIKLLSVLNHQDQPFVIRIRLPRE